MASRTDLAGFLRDDTPSLGSLLHEAIARGEFEGAWRATGNFQSFGTTSSPNVCKADGGGLEVAGIENLLSNLEAQIVERLGHDPRGKLRVRVYEAGNSMVPNVDLSRLLDVNVYSEEEGDPRQLRAQLVEERNENFRLRAQLADLHGHLLAQAQIMGTMASESMKNLAQVGTVRAQITAAGDAGQLNSAVGVLVLMMGLPLLRETFDLPDHMPLSKVVALMVERLKQAVYGVPEAAPGRIAPPAKQLGDGVSAGNLSTEDEPEAPSDEAEPVNGQHHPALSPARPSAAQVLDWFREDPAWGVEIYNGLMADPALLLSLKAHKEHAV